MYFIKVKIMRNVDLREYGTLFIVYPACCTDVPEYDYDAVYDAFAFNSLLTRVESIQASSMVAIECNEVSNKCLYHVPTTKPMRIEEFEQTQAQVTSQVKHLINTWP